MFFNIIEYFSFINVLLLLLFLIIVVFFLLILSSNCNVLSGNSIEFIATLFSLILLVMLISPALLTIIDINNTILPSFIVYSLGIQWAWQYTVTLSNYTCFIDQYLIHSSSVNYLWDFNCYLILPVYSYISILSGSLDVIHNFGYQAFGIKIDAIPGSINVTNTLSLLWNGEYSGNCYELCGQGHFSMLMLSSVL